MNEKDFDESPMNKIEKNEERAQAICPDFDENFNLLLKFEQMNSTSRDRLHSIVIEELNDGKKIQPSEVDDFANKLREMPPFNGSLPQDCQRILERFKRSAGHNVPPSAEDVHAFEDRLRKTMPAGANGLLPADVEAFIRRMQQDVHRTGTKLIILPGDLPKTSTKNPG
jgi:hypothetical protein